MSFPAQQSFPGHTACGKAIVPNSLCASQLKRTGSVKEIFQQWRVKVEIGNEELKPSGKSGNNCAAR